MLHHNTYYVYATSLATCFYLLDVIDSTEILFFNAQHSHESGENRRSILDLQPWNPGRMPQSSPLIGSVVVWGKHETMMSSPVSIMH